MASDLDTKFAPFEAKMRKEGLSDSAIAAFRHSFNELISGSTGAITEDSIAPAHNLAELDDIKKNVKQNANLLSEVVVLKLNGGLGTSMGLDRAKSLLEVKNGDTFLDLTAKQVMAMRQRFKAPVKFMLMNSFNTSSDTLSFLSKYPSIISDSVLELMQNKVPKIHRETLQPATWSNNHQLEWCPPGHGDLYTALYGSGILDTLLAQGVRYMFVSNSDNLGATLDLDLLTYFAELGAPFLMECCHRTEADKKGGHLAQRVSDGRLILRESAQCRKEDEHAFQDISRHQFFNTNNLWVRLDHLKALMDSRGGFVPLPTILNKKTVDPQIDSSDPVYQLETAMGAAIECFEGASAVAVNRDRFAPVKKSSDLFLLRSDAYIVNEHNVLDLNPACHGVAPIVDLDDKKYKLVQHLEAATRGGIPSLVHCKKLTVKGEVWFTSKNIFSGTVSIINNSNEPKVLPAGHYTDGSVIDLSSNLGLGALKPLWVNTQAFHDQKPGTSGLRKKTRVFVDNEMYLPNFVQATFNALSDARVDFAEGSLLLGGDGRFYNDVAIQVILEIAVANGVKRVLIGENGLLSTPAVSAIIRERQPKWQKPFGAFILTASHNPGGIEEDFGIKYNCENGGPAPEKLTEAIYSLTKTINFVKKCPHFPKIDITKSGVTEVYSDDKQVLVTVEVISSTQTHVDLLKSIFDFDKLRALFRRPDFSFRYDCMHGVQGPYARAVFVDELGCHESCLMNAVPKPDFNGHHADPNLTYARDICDVMGIDEKGLPKKVLKSDGTEEHHIPSFGAACDGDADRNMILGPNFFVTPSDSLAVLTSHADVIPFFRQQGGIKSVARSMPTSGAVDRVAKALNLHFFETPTGWKFFGNAMDSKDLFNGQNFNPMICGEESFGTGSNHVREKDGLWAVLMWLSILEHYNCDPQKPFVSVETIVRRHWATYGRNYYCRYDYEGVASDKANMVMKTLRDQLSTLKGQTLGSFTVDVADEFTYVDPVDKSVSKNQGIRILFQDGSRIIYRLSGTAGSGATIRVYLERYESSSGRIDQLTSTMLEELVNIALQVSRIPEITGFNSPTVIT